MGYQDRTSLNKNGIIYISSTPGENEGAQIPFREILTERIKDHASQPDYVSDNKCIKVKISGD